MKDLYSSDNERLIVALLNNNKIYAQQLLDGGRVEPEKLFRLADRHMVSALVFDRISRLRIEGTVSEFFSMDDARTLRKSVAVNMRLRHELKLVVEILKKEGIDFLLIKGFAIDKSPLRMMNDIDILIDGKNLKKTFTILENTGYRYIGSGVMSDKEICNPFSTLSWNNQFQFESQTRIVSIEIHTNLFEGDRIRLENLERLLNKVNLFWEQARRDTDLKCFIPSTEATLALLCIHSATKRSPAHNTYILRHAYDIAEIFKGNLDMERFLFLCREWEIEYYAYTALRLTALSLGIQQTMEAAALLESSLTLRQKRLSEIHLKCFQGLGHASLFYRKLYALYMPPSIGGGFRKALRWYREQIFPTLWQQRGRFGIKRNSPAVFLTYLYGPFVRAYDILARKLCGD